MDDYPEPRMPAPFQVLIKLGRVVRDGDIPINEKRRMVADLTSEAMEKLEAYDGPFMNIVEKAVLDRVREAKEKVGIK